MHIPQIQHTAQGSGLYIVFLDGVAQTPEHVTTREADEHSTNLKLANPNSVVTYTQNLVVTTTLSYLDDPAPEPVPTPEPAPTPSPSDLLLFDGFEYVVGRDDPNASQIFMQNGWDGCKTLQSGEPGARGYLYTVDQIPGYVGEFPGGGSRVLAIEALPRSLGFQTDFYLQYGVGADPAYDNAIPANVWFQFWLYINHYGTQLSGINEGKLLYSCAGTYPCQQTKWLMILDHESKPPNYTSLPADQGAFLWNDSSALSGNPIVYPGHEDERWKFGPQDVATHIGMNQWVQVKLHFDTTGPDGVYEQWLRPMYGQWVKTAEYIGGVSPPGFVWKCVPGGNRVFRMPTTIGMNTNDPSLNHDLWMYMDNFAMARTEAALPQY